MQTFGPEYDKDRDGKRIFTQFERIRQYMADGQWHTLAEISKATNYPESSISAQLRHMRKPKFGSLSVNKRRREVDGGTWEYSVGAPNVQ